VPSARRYVVDTNLYVDALRSEEGRAALTAFHSAYAPFEHLSAVVAHELRAGVRGHSAIKLERYVLSPFERRGRIVTPSYAAWKEAGRVLARLTAPAQWANVTRSFVNDVLLAMSCREAGMVLVTNNVRDFTRIASVQPFDFVPPWPRPPS